MFQLLLAVIYLAFISLGLPDSLLGSAWPQMHLDLGAQLSMEGIISMLISCGTVISSLFSEKIVWNGNDFGSKYTFNSCCIIWIFSFRKLLYVMLPCDSLWIGSRSNRCSA